MIASLPICQRLHEALPNLLAIYGFGSRISGEANHDSDLDLAVLLAGYADPLQLWQLSSHIAELTACPVDLLDFRAASTVMQYRILTTGERWWAKDHRVNLYEAAILSEKTELDTARAPLLQDIQREGSVYGR